MGCASSQHQLEMSHLNQYDMWMLRSHCLVSSHCRHQNHRQLRQLSNHQHKKIKPLRRWIRLHPNSFRCHIIYGVFS